MINVTQAMIENAIKNHKDEIEKVADRVFKLGCHEGNVNGNKIIILPFAELTHMEVTIIHPDNSAEQKSVSCKQLASTCELMNDPRKLLSLKRRLVDEKETLILIEDMLNQHEKDNVLTEDEEEEIRSFFNTHGKTPTEQDDQNSKPTDFNEISNPTLARDRMVKDYLYREYIRRNSTYKNISRTALICLAMHWMELKSIYVNSPYKIDIEKSTEYAVRTIIEKYLGKEEAEF